LDSPTTTPNPQQPHNSMGNYKEINQKGLAFHAEEKQKYYKEEKKTRFRMCLLL